MAQTFATIEDMEFASKTRMHAQAEARKTLAAAGHPGSPAYIAQVAANRAEFGSYSTVYAGDLAVEAIVPTNRTVYRKPHVRMVYKDGRKAITREQAVAILATQG